ncbi:MAG: hypothetical protein NT154_16795 [Verrucomicrobia bacterium]|nr:hypothetical protein [Verrucomicrobiota bacterium]
MNPRMQKRDKKAEPAHARGAVLAFGKNCQRRSIILIFARALPALALLALVPASAHATYVYTWVLSTGPTLAATMRVPDAVIARGVIRAADLAGPSGFLANTPVGTFTTLSADSSLRVDPTSGALLISTNSLTATNGTDTLLLSATGFFIPTSRLQSRGKGIWKVTRLPGLPPQLQISFLGFADGHTQLQVTSTADMAFAI